MKPALMGLDDNRIDTVHHAGIGVFRSVKFYKRKMRVQDQETKHLWVDHRGLADYFPGGFDGDESA